MNVFNTRDQYAQLLSLIAACDRAYAEDSQHPTRGSEFSQRMAETSTAVDEYLAQFGVEYADLDDAHFFATCRLIRELQANQPVSGGVQ